MALVLLDRAKETTTVVGTGTATLLGAVTSYQSLAGVGNGNTTYYCIVDQVGANWEVGIGTYTASGTTLARTTVLASSNAGALVVFTTGVKDVFVTYPSEKGVWYDASGNVLFTGTTTATNLAYTGTLTGSTGILNIGSGQLYKDASGNVGIGTSSPDSVLSVYATNKTIPAISARYSAAGFKAGFSVYNVNGYPYLSFNVNPVTSSNSGTYDITGVASKIDFASSASSADIIFSNAISGTAGTAISWLERMRIDSSGNLLVGTTSPTYSSKLSIYAGATTGTTYNVSAATGGSVVTNQQQSTSVSTSAVVILTPNQYASFCVVFGSDGTNRFMDLILCGLGTGTIQVVSSFTVSGSPAARTYTQSSSTYRLAMGSGTYTVKVSTITMDG